MNFFPASAALPSPCLMDQMKRTIPAKNATTESERRRIPMEPTTDLLTVVMKLPKSVTRTALIPSVEAVWTAWAKARESVERR